jgi:hypothetical protein
MKSYAHGCRTTRSLRTREQERSVKPLRSWRFALCGQQTGAIACVLAPTRVLTMLREETVNHLARLGDLIQSP